MQDELAYTPSETQEFERELPDIGSHNAVCCQIHNIGHQLYEGKVSISPKVVMIFELDQKLKGGQLAGKPMTISRTFSYYLADGAALRQFLEAWRGKTFTKDEIDTFTLRNLISAPCQLILIHKPSKRGKMTAYIAGIARKAADAVAIPVTYTETPKWVLEDKDKAVTAPGKKPSFDESAKSANPNPEDDLPF